MKLTSLHASHANRSIPPRGFALVVTLVLMVLLSILALGLLSLSSVELRNTATWQNQSLARQNALLALNLAIGELQKNLGPDQRTSTTASLLDENSNNPNWVGAWNTEGGFRGWMVSGNEATTQPADPAADVSVQAFTPSFDNGSDKSVNVVGAKTLGLNAARKDQVFAPMVDIGTGDHPKGRYAWWVGDEGTKANLAAPILPLPPGSMDDRLLFSSGSPNRGFPTLGGVWEKWLPGGDGLLDGTDGKFVTRKQISLADPSPTGTLGREAQEHFHDFTVSSAGVLSDSKNGGLKKDLSIAFEIPESAFRKSEFTNLLTEGETPNAYVKDHGTGVKSGSPFRNRLTKTLVNYPVETGNYRGPTYDILRDHYQLYRRFVNPFSASAKIGSQVGAPNKPDVGSSPWFNITGNVKEGSQAIRDSNIRPLTTEIVPELIHFAYTISLQSYKVGGDPPNTSRIRLIVNPFMALYNPYNTVLESPPLFLRIARMEVGIELAYSKNSSGYTNYTEFHLLKPWADTTSQKSPAAYQSVDHYISDSGDPHPPTSGAPAITLQPGEIKLYTITGGQPIDVDEKFNSANKALTYQAISDPTDPKQLFSSGLYTELGYTKDDRNKPNDADNLPDPFLIADGDTFKVRAANSTLGSSSQDAGNFPPLGNDFNEYLEIMVKQGQPFSGDLRNNTADGWPEIRKMRLLFASYWNGKPSPPDPLTLSTLAIQGDPAEPDGGARFYVAQSDLHWKTAIGEAGTDNNFSLATHNPRATEQTNMGAGGQGPNSTRGPATWTGSTKRLDGSQPNFNIRFWGTGKDIQDGGQQFLALWDIPRKPITSLASFQHANVGRLHTTPAYIIGNSYPSPYVPQNALENKSATKSFWNFDDSYLFNAALFDSYFFSGVNPGATGSSWNNRIANSAVRLGGSDSTSMAPLQEQIDDWISGTGKLANPHIAFVQPSGRQTQTASEALDLAKRYQAVQTKLSKSDDIRPHNAIAAYSLNLGAFNVNSVSIDAWRVILAGLREAPVDHLSSPGAPSLNVDSESSSPFAGSSLPGSDSSTGSDEDLWNGFRRLDDDEIETLATEIVAGIRSRAQANDRPFRTLGEFVNRSIESNSPLSGVLQTSIDNGGFNDSGNLSSLAPGQADKNFRTKKMTPPETATVDYANPAALASSTIAGAPQWLTQADVLEAIGPQLSARSDTFTIRAYGESVNPVTGLTTGRAWLEATVQRGTGFVDSSEDAALPTVSLKSPTNLQFGRRFNVTAFRWLSPEEI